MALKPVCTKCEQEHWRFVPCAEAAVANTQEADAAAKREALKVVPLWRGPNGELNNPKALIHIRPGDAA